MNSYNMSLKLLRFSCNITIYIYNMNKEIEYENIRYDMYFYKQYKLRGRNR
jgi:hypothetical protein